MSDATPSKTLLLLHLPIVSIRRNNFVHQR